MDTAIEDILPSLDSQRGGCLEAAMSTQGGKEMGDRLYCSPLNSHT